QPPMAISLLVNPDELIAELLRERKQLDIRGLILVHRSENEFYGKSADSPLRQKFSAAFQHLQIIALGVDLQVIDRFNVLLLTITIERGDWNGHAPGLSVPDRFEQRIVDAVILCDLKGQDSFLISQGQVFRANSGII